MRPTPRRYIAAPGELETRAKGGPCLAGQWASLQRGCPPDARPSTYISELRRLETSETGRPGSLRRHRRSALSRTMREACVDKGLDARDMLYWDDFSEGTFIGGDRAGYAVHVDCIQTSNVGTMFSGHKMLAIWKYAETTFNSRAPLPSPA